MNDMINQRQSVEEIFCAALELPDAEREAFLDRACDDAPEIRPLIAELLREEERAGSFLRLPVLQSASLVGMPAASRQEASAETSPEAWARWIEPRFAPGATIADRFVVTRFLARGGMGEVYEVQDTLLHGEHVALKLIRPEIAADAGSTHRFEQEVLLARKVHHPNLCPIYEIFRCESPEPPYLFLTMKLLQGETLDAQLRRGQGLTRQEKILVCSKLIAAVAAIHLAGVIHRDIKPKNVMLERTGTRLAVIVLDFGLARLHQSEATVLKTGMVAGTPGYLAPELLQGQHPTRATDLFALGIVMHQVLVGDVPREAENGLSRVVSPGLRTCDAPSHLCDAVEGFLSDDPEQRCRAFKAVRAQLRSPVSASSALPVVQPASVISRRHVIAASLASACVLGGGVVWKHDWLDDLLHPLPKRRIVALLDWPPAKDTRTRPVVLSLIDSISNELSRAEAFDRDFFVTAQKASTDLSSLAQLSEVRDSLGANLVLAASGAAEAERLRISLHVMDSATGMVIRARTLFSSLEDQLSLPASVVHAAAQLLDVKQYQPDKRLRNPGSTHPEALAAFQAAEALMKQENDAGLDAAINKYREAIEDDPHFAMAFAKLSQAYGHVYGVRRETGALHLALANAEHALALDPVLVEAHLARAFLLEQTGEEQAALDEMEKTLALDPLNPTTLLWLARVLTRMNRWADAERTFHKLLQQRPNLWLAYSELGFALHGQARWKEAIDCFRTATVAAPKNALAASNLGVEYLQIGEFEKGTAYLRRSLALQPDYDGAAANLSLALRYQGKPEQALPFALAATAANPGQDANWLELGDCYASMPHRDREAKAAYERAAGEADDHLRTDRTNGPGWMLLALYEAKCGAPAKATASLARADALRSDDMDSQLYKVRTLELLGMREEALATLRRCFGRGATELQIAPFPDLGSLRADSRYQVLRSVGGVARG